MSKKRKHFVFIALYAVLLLLLFLFGYKQNFNDKIVEVKLSQRDNTSIRVCSWNVKNYCLALRYENKKSGYLPKPASEKIALYEALQFIDADVLLIQEMGSEPFLNELKADLKKYDLHYPYACLSGNQTSIRLAILSKIPFEQVFDFSDLDFEFDDNLVNSRGTLGVMFKSFDTQWYVFNLHLKSKIGAKKKDNLFTAFRHAQAKNISQKISKFINEAPLILAGDFNDEPSSGLENIFSQYGLSLLEQSDSLGSPTSYYWQKKNQHFQYDYFFVSDKMRNLVVAPASILNMPFTQNASDHKPIYLDLNFLNLN